MKMTSSSAFDSYGDRAGTIKNRNVIDDVPENDDAWLRDTADLVVDHEMIGTPQAEHARSERTLPSKFGQRRW